MDIIETGHGVDHLCGMNIFGNDCNDKPYTHEGVLHTNPFIRKLQYQDCSGDTMYAIYQINGVFLLWKDSDADYPADLTGALEFIKE
jgi:hypothetical protein